ncbi:response regulator transcription factor [Echinicola sp. CAU 1574]|uniref:Response regulator transcription factor n=1 Tax=Echinicola arenosa TaxID=2774144 RepID=A0ABR9ALZ3_9BACT|nr:LytTR family DNA-binding domain-containing protein [Echinicola arenosa]MBD8488853.1 response regulator transcription factor [Echinicola arenosa]
MDPLSIITVDDDLTAHVVFKKLLKKCNIQLSELKQFLSPELFLKDGEARRGNFDLLFLDIEMSPVNGITFLEQLDELISHPKYEVILLTSHENFALEAFKHNVFDYLLKPLCEESLNNCVQKWISQKNKILKSEEVTLLKNLIDLRKHHPSKIAIPCLKGYEIVNVDEIVRCEADGNYSKISVLNHQNKLNVMLVSRKLKDLGHILEEEGFLRVHNSHLINPDHVVRILKEHGGILEMIDGTKVRITKNKNDVFNTIFQKIPRP